MFGTENAEFIQINKVQAPQKLQHFRKAVDRLQRKFCCSTWRGGIGSSLHSNKTVEMHTTKLL
jgi:hypothetical protein